jgi:tetratricopeptide (TPR) repeat protein
MRGFLYLLIVSALSLGLSSGLAAQTARVSEGIHVLKTYPFSEPNPVPALTRDVRLYPYHSFLGYSKDAVPQEWKVVLLENDFIEVFVLPEVGGKVWGARVKESGHEFIYRNEVMKFRNIALRGPWTSGGIEFNFGVIGHTPATATPVDYSFRENPDGSVSCFVGGMDLPSRTHWRVEIRLPADRAYFETHVLWYNPTPLEQPYYSWMTAAAFARSDLEMSIPGSAFLEHSGVVRSWPLDTLGRYLPLYAENAFAGNKSYHVVGEFNDFFGGYYRDEDYGFGHWSHYEDMPGQKLWLWALSPEGGIWEDLLTDTDGQYIEFQAGRLLVQYQPGPNINPITQAGFGPGTTDRWSETWFPLEGLGGLTDASREGAMYVEHEDNSLTVRVHSFGLSSDTVLISSGGSLVATVPVDLLVLEPVELTVEIPARGEFQVRLPLLGLNYSFNPKSRLLSKPFAIDSSANEQIPAVDRSVFEARELMKARYYGQARALFIAALADEPWHRSALLGLADVEFRRGRYEGGLIHVRRALQLDAYDAEANFLAGNLYRALGNPTEAREAFGWALRSMEFRSAAYLQLAEIGLAAGDLAEAHRYAGLAIDYDRYSLAARQVLAIASRRVGDTIQAKRVHQQLLDIDPLHHFVAAEAYLQINDRSGNFLAAETAAKVFVDGLQGEYPDQVLLELAIDYLRRGSRSDALAMVDLGPRVSSNPLFRAWQAWLGEDLSALAGGAAAAFSLPFRRETIPVLEWAVSRNEHWFWRYLLSLNLWARDRKEEATSYFETIGNEADFAPMYVSRGLLLQRTRGRNPEPDLRQAILVGGQNRIIHIHLIRYLQAQGLWHEALEAGEIARARFQPDFDLDLLHVRSLNNLERPAEALAMLNSTHVLPSENAGSSHRLYEQAHTLAALAALETGKLDLAASHLGSAREWPGHLGQGRPYEPEERLVLFLLGRIAQHQGDQVRAETAFSSVITATTLELGLMSRLDLLAIPSLLAIGLPVEVLSEDSALSQFANAVIYEVERGMSFADAASKMIPQFVALFEGLDGRLIARALTMLP